MKQLAGVVFLLIPVLSGAFPQNEITEYSADGIECFSCTSRLFAPCATTTPSSDLSKVKSSSDLPKVKCKDPRDQCVTAIVDYDTQRGCAKEVNRTSDAISKLCSTPLCNGEVIPFSRLQCYQCEGKDCIKDFQGTLKPCANYKNGDFCVTDVTETGILRRCLSDPDIRVGKFAKMCDQTGCNSYDMTYSSSCISCSEVNSTSCVRFSPPGKTCAIPVVNTCKDTLLLNERIKCFTYQAPNKVVRGCLKDAGELALDKENFRTCEGHLCNDKCVPVKCFKCDSRTNPQCANQVNELEPQICPRDMACYAAQTSDGATIRGCGEYSSEAKQISTCYEDGCNNKVHHPPTDASGVGTGRKVSPGKDNSSKDGNKLPCHGDGCKKTTNGTTKNNAQPEKQHAYCYQCTASTINCVNSPTEFMLKPCPSPTDTCFQYFNMDHEMVRGCKSDKSYTTCLALRANCYQCSGKGCNSIPQFKETCHGDGCNNKVHPPTGASGVGTDIQVPPSISSDSSKNDNKVPSSHSAMSHKGAFDFNVNFFGGNGNKVTIINNYKAQQESEIVD